VSVGPAPRAGKGSTNELLLGTRNHGKIAEFRELFSSIPSLHILTVDDVGFSEVPETGHTFLGNAILKAESICQETGRPVLSEDAGLEVEALNGAPGVYSARFAGESVDYAANNRLLLQRLRGVENRRARFVAVAVLRLPDGQIFATTGMLPGTIVREPRGEGGFGYDPLFLPDGESRTLAEITTAEKNWISHRMKTLTRMMPILEQLASEGELRSSGALP